MPRKAEQERKQERYIRTVSGGWSQDPSGLWHYKNTGGGNVRGAAYNAIAEPAPGPSWFWFNEEPTPIYKGDTVETLVAIWRHWRALLENRRDVLLQLLAALPKEGLLL